MDYTISDKNEAWLLPHLQTFFNDKTIYRSTMNKHDVFDYYNKADKKFVGELKSRNVDFNTYPTTMIGMNKINSCNKPDVDYYFFFHFKNNVVKYIKYDVTRFNRFEKNIGGRKDRGKVESALYCFIPINECETLLI